MTPTVSFKELLSLVATRIEEAGFHRKGSSFYLREGGNWGVVNFQKSGKSTADAILFTARRLARRFVEVRCRGGQYFGFFQQARAGLG